MSNVFIKGAKGPIELATENELTFNYSVPMNGYKNGSPNIVGNKQWSPIPGLNRIYIAPIDLYGSNKVDFSFKENISNNLYWAYLILKDPSETFLNNVLVCTDWYKDTTMQVTIPQGGNYVVPILGTTDNTQMNPTDYDNSDFLNINFKVNIAKYLKDNFTILEKQIGGGAK